ncbi:hypothetical protein EHM92_09315 [bacterium]|nr:MAG: hypothetical protein EHM92_09315 [bacterium]
MNSHRLQSAASTISRRSFLGASAATLAGFSSLGGAARDSPPNVLFILFDDLNDSVEGMGGHPQARTPNIDRLMRKGVQFTNAHSNAPICAPSRACMMSGIYPHHSELIEFKPFSSSQVLAKSVTFFEHFKKRSCTTSNSPTGRNQAASRWWLLPQACAKAGSPAIIQSRTSISIRPWSTIASCPKRRMPTKAGVRWTATA